MHGTPINRVFDRSMRRVMSNVSSFCWGLASAMQTLLCISSPCRQSNATPQHDFLMGAGCRRPLRGEIWGKWPANHVLLCRSSCLQESHAPGLGSAGHSRWPFPAPHSSRTDADMAKVTTGPTPSSPAAGRTAGSCKAEARRRSETGQCSASSKSPPRPSFQGAPGGLGSYLPPTFVV